VNLKPCPFCGKDRAIGKKVRTVGSRARYWIECEYCHAQGPAEELDPSCECYEKAAKAWNERNME
jgi:Lar family restriction alleviation protein